MHRKARLVFTNARKALIQSAPWSYVWTSAVAKVGLPKRYGFHGLRHYFATLLIHNGAGVKTVQMALGHANPTITLNTYIGGWPEAVDRTRNIVDMALALPPKPSGSA